MRKVRVGFGFIFRVGGLAASLPATQLEGRGCCPRQDPHDYTNMNLAASDLLAGTGKPT